MANRKGVRISKTKAVVSIASLYWFLREFQPATAIPALIAMTELAVEASDFGNYGAPDGLTYMEADEATDHLYALFLDKNAVEEFPEQEVYFTVDNARMELTIYLEKPKPRPSRKKKPRSPKRSPNMTTPLPVRLLRSGDSLN